MHKKEQQMRENFRDVAVSLKEEKGGEKWRAAHYKDDRLVFIQKKNDGSLSL